MNIPQSSSAHRLFKRPSREQACGGGLTSSQFRLAPALSATTEQDCSRPLRRNMPMRYSHIIIIGSSAFQKTIRQEQAYVRGLSSRVPSGACSQRCHFTSHGTCCGSQLAGCQKRSSCPAGAPHTFRSCHQVVEYGPAVRTDTLMGHLKPHRRAVADYLWASLSEVEDYQRLSRRVSAARKCRPATSGHSP